jgi:hypothetical protein
MNVEPTFVIGGRASPDVGGVTGKLVRTSDGQTVNGTTILFQIGGLQTRRPRNAVRDPHPTRARWIILFESVLSGAYEIQVTGYLTTAGTVMATPRNVTVQGAFAISITHPPPGPYTLSAEEKEFFVTSGTLGMGHQAISATMNNIDGDLVYSRSGFWSAAFSPLDAGDFTLVAIDNFNHLDSNDEVTVT